MNKAIAIVKDWYKSIVEPFELIKDSGIIYQKSCFMDRTDIYDCSAYLGNNGRTVLAV